MGVIENRGIVDCNERNGVSTLFVHKAVFLEGGGYTCSEAIAS